VICYCANGSKAFEKEYIEIHAAGSTAILRDFRALEIGIGGRVRKTSLRVQDKGQRAMVLEFIGAVKSGGPPPIPFEQLSAVTRATFAAVRSLRERRPVLLD
jgi:predicted dehydrogenase